MAHFGDSFMPARALRAPLQSRCSLTEEQEEYSPLKQLTLQYNCTEINGEELSELMFEMGVLSVSIEVLTEKAEILNDERRWSDLGKQKSWATALLRANFPASFDAKHLLNILSDTYPGIQMEISLDNVEDVSPPTFSLDWTTVVV